MSELDKLTLKEISNRLEKLASLNMDAKERPQGLTSQESLEYETLLDEFVRRADA